MYILHFFNVEYAKNTKTIMLRYCECEKESRLICQLKGTYGCGQKITK